MFIIVKSKCLKGTLKCVSVAQNSYNSSYMTMIYSVSPSFGHSKADRMKFPVVKVNFTPPLQSMAVTVCLDDVFNGTVTPLAARSNRSTCR